MAEAITAARAQRRTLDASAYGVSDDDAYAVQDALTHRRLAAGESVVGWKLGYTTAAMRQAMGVDAPNHGPLTDRMVLASPATTSARLIQPRVEPEIAVRLRADGSIASRHLALEVVDSVWAGYRFTWADNTADGSSAALAVVSEAQLPDDLAGREVVLRTSDGAESTTVLGADTPDPVDSVDWLLAELAHRSCVPPEGAVVLTGGLLPPLPLPDGGWAEATLAGLTARITWRMDP
jgi:2-keto-4-pentenoate hydratase